MYMILFQEHPGHLYVQHHQQEDLLAVRGHVSLSCLSQSHETTLQLLYAMSHEFVIYIFYHTIFLIEHLTNGNQDVIYTNIYSMWSNAMVRVSARYETHKEAHSIICQ